MACGSPAELPATSVTVQESDSAGIAIVEISGQVDDLPTWAATGAPTVEVRGDAAPFIGRVGQVALLGDGRLIVEDDQAKTLYSVDADGAAFALLGSEGDGPGEFRDISALSVTQGDTVFAFDRRHLRFTVIDPTGSVVRTVALEAYEDGTTIRRGWSLGASHWITHTTTPLAVEDSPGTIQRDQRDVVLNALDESGAVIGMQAPFEGGYTIRGIINGRGIIIVAPFANTPIVAPGPGFMVHGSAVHYDLVVSSTALTPTRIVRWNGWRKPVSDALLESSRAQAAERFGDLDPSNPETTQLVVDAMFTESLLPDRLPALGGAFVDELGQIWVSAFRPSTDPWSQSEAWHVLSPQGTPLAKVRLPERSRLVAVRSDRVALVSLDDLDVEQVQVFAVQPMEGQ